MDQLLLEESSITLEITDLNDSFASPPPSGRPSGHLSSSLQPARGAQLLFPPNEDNRGSEEAAARLTKDSDAIPRNH